tara:strand:+ start:6 stop:1439 length:1434 start_codon:yes stop_codon:yes gene_type:complete
MPTILGANTLSSGYDVDNSLRVDRNSGDYLTRNESQDQSDGKKITISIWFKVGAHLGTTRYFFGGHADGSYTNEIGITSNNQLNFSCVANGTNQVTTSRYFRDPSAWYHVVAVFDSTEGTSTDRIKLYINGTQETNFASSSYPSENAVTEYLKNGGVTRVGDKGSGGNNWDGYLAEIFVLDGQALTPSSFGEFDEDTPTVWKPKDCKDDLTFGNNGFYLDFKDSSNLGNDASSNASDFSANNIDATNQSTDTCTNNFCTLNPIDTSAGVSFDLTEGNLELGDIGSGDNDHGLRGTFGVNAGKWYYEVKRLETSGTFGVVGSEVKLEFDLENNTSGPAHIMSSNGTGSSLVYWNDGNFTNDASLQGYGANDIIGVALDMDNGKLFFSINGVFKGFNNSSSDPAAGTNANFTDIPTDGTFMMPYVSKRGTADPSDQYNFGNPSFSVSSGNTDGNGFGNFEYAPPSGFLALCTKNLAESG